MSFIEFIGTEMCCETEDGKLFLDELQRVRSFSLDKNKLKLYYNETDYFLFK
jgi:hypothetical protein